MPTVYNLRILYMNIRIKALYNSCLDLLFPKVCGVCQVVLDKSQSQSICEECSCGIRRIVPPFCSSCGMELYSQSGENYICGSCLKNPPPFETARSLYRYDDQMRTLITRLKYHKDTSVLATLGTLMREADLFEFSSCDYIVPVPLHKKRLQERGFNQALLLAKACFDAKDTGIHTSLLYRTVNTVPQVLLDAKTRRRSLNGVFRVNGSVAISGKSICLIDDVYTTGTTVSYCSRELVRGGADRVLVLTIARVRASRRGRQRI